MDTDKNQDLDFVLSVSILFICGKMNSFSVFSVTPW